MTRGGDLDAATESRARGRAASAQLTEADYLYGQLAAFRRKEERALGLIAQAAGPLGVAFSGGKDSTVVLDLVRREWPDAPAGWYDDGAQLADTVAFISGVPNVMRYPADGGGLIELCRQNGYWGREPLSPTPRRVDFGKVLISIPAQKFAEEYSLKTMALGLRQEESVRRRIVLRRNGESYFVKEDNLYHLCPIAGWTVEDIWAYIAVHGVSYNPAYDKMAELGITREHQRIGPGLGTMTAGFGFFVYLKQLDLELWNRLAAEFPLVRKYA